MGKILSKSQIILIIFLMIVNIALGVDSEYKNTLTKVEVTKSSDSSYNINLYTQNSIPNGAKVIKKSDLSYYILLPETKNSASVSAPTGGDIKQVNTATYPYAGGGKNNGYTKINISTTKPITFTINSKSATTTKVAQKPKETKSADKVIIAKPQETVTAKAQQKPTQQVQQPTQQKLITLAQVEAAKTQAMQNPPEKVQTPKVQNKKEQPKAKTIIPKKAETNILAKITKPKEVKNTVKPKAVQQVKQQPKQAIKQIKQPQKQFIKPQIAKQQQKQIVKQQPKQAIKQVAKQPKPTAAVQKPKVAAVQPKPQVKGGSLEEEVARRMQAPVEQPKEEVKVQQNIETEVVDNPIVKQENEVKAEKPQAEETQEPIYYREASGLQKILFEYGITMSDLFLLILAFVLTLILASILFSKRYENRARVKNKSELNDIATTSTLHPKKLHKEEREESKNRQFIENVEIKQDETDVQEDVQEASVSEEISSENAIKIEEVQISTEPVEEVHTVKVVEPVVFANEDANEDVIEQATFAPTPTFTLSDTEVTPVSDVQEDIIEEQEQEISETTTEVIQEVSDVESGIENDVEPSYVETPTRNPRRTAATYPNITEYKDIEPTPTKADSVMPKNVQPPEVPVIKPDEPYVLSSVEIAPKRGFMCVAYQNNINLMGYILDDVFALYDFKKPELDNYKIKFKMSERMEKGANFIVKIDNQKLIVKVTRHSMKLEITI